MGVTDWVTALSRHTDSEIPADARQTEYAQWKTRQLRPDSGEESRRGGSPVDGGEDINWESR